MPQWNNGEFFISTNKKYLDIELIHSFLNQEAYWSKGITREIVMKSIENTNLCFGVYKGEVGKSSIEQVGFARVITDLATFAYLSDVFIVHDYRNLGLSKWLMDVITNHPELQDIRRFMLATQDAHTLYEKFGFKKIDNPEFFMQISRRNIKKM